MKPIEYLVTSEEMQTYDRNTTEYFKVPSLVLMEQAALALTEELLSLLSFRTVLVLAGKGNNGGDAMAAARILFQKGFKVCVCVVGNDALKKEAFSESTALQFSILQRMQVPIVTKPEKTSYDLIIDGIFGVGLNREITGETAGFIQEINAYSGKKAAIDIPSGVHATTGRVMGTALKADVTITFAFLKRGCVLYPGAGYAGKIIKKEIGITAQSFLGKTPSMFALTGKAKEYLPARDPGGHKGSFGKILLIAGSSTIGGAALLAGKSAFLTGCGMLRICTHKEQRTEIFRAIPEALVDAYETKEEALLLLKKGIPWADVIAIGPGIGTDETASAMLEAVICHGTKPLVLDADALNLLAEPDCFGLLQQVQRKEETRHKLILTPHLMELARLSHLDRTVLETKGIEAAQVLAEQLEGVLIKKDARTVICAKNKPLAINLCGNSGMATAGSGDVLTGITAAMLAAGMDAFEAAVAAVYLHGKAGDAAAAKKGEYSLMASDLWEELAELLK